MPMIYTIYDKIMSNMITTHDDNMWWWNKLLIHDEDTRSPYMIIIYDDYTWNRRNGVHPQEGNLTGNYNAKLTFSQKTWNDPISDGIISIRVFFNNIEEIARQRAELQKKHKLNDLLNEFARIS